MLLCCCRCEFNFRKNFIYGVIFIFTAASLRLGERLLINLPEEKIEKIGLLLIFGTILIIVGSISQGFVQLKLDMLVSILPEDFRGTLMHAQASATVSSSIVYVIYLGFREIHQEDETILVIVEGVFSLIAFFIYTFLCYKTV